MSLKDISQKWKNLLTHQWNVQKQVANLNHSINFKTGTRSKLEIKKQMSNAKIECQADRYLRLQQDLETWTNRLDHCSKLQVELKKKMAKKSFNRTKRKINHKSASQSENIKAERRNNLSAEYEDPETLLFEYEQFEKECRNQMVKIMVEIQSALSTVKKI